MSNYEPILYMTFPQIAEMESKAAIAEQERIIKLLKGEGSAISGCCFQVDCCLAFADLIALIKGENK